MSCDWGLRMAEDNNAVNRRIYGTGRENELDGVRIRDIIDAIFPGIEADEAEFLLFEETGYPQFWATKDPALEISSRMRKVWRAQNRWERRKARKNVA